MTAKTVCRWLLASVLLLFAGVCLRTGVAGAALILGSVGTIGWVAACMAHPWLGARSCYRVRYYSPPGESPLGGGIVQALCNMAQGTVVSVVWQRRRGELILFMEVPKYSEEVFRGMLPRLLPEATLEPVPAPPALPDAAGIYRWPLQGVGAGAGTAQDPFAFDQLCSEASFTGDLELRVNLTRWGGNVVVHGTPGPDLKTAGVRPFFQSLWRHITPRTTKVCSYADDGDCTRKGGSVSGNVAGKGKKPWMRVLRFQPSSQPSSGPIALVSSLSSLLRAYPLLESWPRELGAGARSNGNITDQTFAMAMRFPATGTASTSRLDSRVGSLIALPADYAPLQGQDLLLLGVASGDGRYIRVPLKRSAPLSGERGNGHFLVIGGTEAERDNTVSGLTDQVTSLGGGLVMLDHGGDRARRLAAQLSPTERSRRCWVDIENPAGSLRLNLLAVPPLDGRGNQAAAEAAALVTALSDCVPLLGGYLSQLGVSIWSTRSGSNLLLDWARVMLIAHHRTRLVGSSTQCMHCTQPPQAQAPDLCTLYELLGESDTLPSLVAAEAAEWEARRGRLVEQLDIAGDDGTAAADLVGQTLREVRERLNSISRAEVRLLAAGLRDQLRPELYHPALSRLWTGPLEAPAALLSRVPGPLLLARLPMTGAVTGTAAGVTGADTTAARLYGLYIIACVVAAGMWRRNSGQSAPSVLLVLQDAPLWLSRETLEPYMDLLDRAGVAVLLSAARWPAREVGAWLLDNTGTWWIHSLNNRDADDGNNGNDGDGVDMVRKRLAGLGVHADLSLSNLPRGLAVLRFPTPSGPAVATVYTDKEHGQVSTGRVSESAVPAHSAKEQEEASNGSQRDIGSHKSESLESVA